MTDPMVTPEFRADMKRVKELTRRKYELISENKKIEDEIARINAKYKEKS